MFKAYPDNGDLLSCARDSKSLIFGSYLSHVILKASYAHLSFNPYFIGCSADFL